MIARVTGPEPAIRAVRGRYSGFGARKNARCDIELSLASEAHEGPSLSGETPAQRPTPDGGLLLQTSSYSAQLSADGRQVRVEGPGWGEGLAAALQQAAVRRLIKRSGLLVHAALVRWGRGMALFAGPSGAGKTTVAGRAGELALCDELVVVLVEGGRWVAHATPYNEGRRGSGRLQAIFLLDRGRGCRAEPLSASSALRLLLPQIVLARDTRQPDAVLHNTAALLEQVPARRLRFTPGAALGAFLEAQGSE